MYEAEDLLSLQYIPTLDLREDTAVCLKSSTGSIATILVSGGSINPGQ